MSGKEQRFVIGRARGCDVVLADESVSRQHAELILLPGGRLFLVDRHSRNGTSLIADGRLRQISQEFVSLEDTVQFGDVRLSARELLEAVRRKVPALDAAPVQGPVEPRPPERKPWVQGTRLVRCACGAVKPAGAPCPACGA